MKSVVISVLLFWGAMMLEQARPDLVPARAILLPLAAVAIFWNRTASGVFAGGVILVVDWIVRPHGVPLLPVGVTFAAVVLLSSGSGHDVWTGARRRLRIPDWAHPAVVVLTGVSLLIGPTFLTRPIGHAEIRSISAQYLLISLPLVLLLTGLMKVATEFGWRRSV